MITDNITNVRPDSVSDNGKQQYDELSDKEANKIETDKTKLDEQAKDSEEELEEIQLAKVEAQNERNSDRPNLENGVNENGINMVDSEQIQHVSQLNNDKEVSKSENLDVWMQDSEKKGEEESNPRINGEIVACSRAAGPEKVACDNSQGVTVGAGLIEKETSKLQFLLAQPDIFEYLRKLNNGELEKRKEEAKEHQNTSMEIDHEEIANKRHAHDGEVKENTDSKDGYESDNVIEKVEVQPANLVFGDLRQYQLDALNWLYSLHNAKLNGILADEMGLGKTIESISIMALIESRKTQQEIQNRKRYHIVIVPKVTLNKWKRELNNWFPDLRVFKFYGDQAEKEVMKENELKERCFDWILTTYEIIIKEKSVLQKLRYEYLILDEAHRIKNDQWVLSQILRKFNTEHRLLLTGTPLQNNLKELWALLNFLMPKLFDSEEEFSDLFQSNDGDAKNQDLIIKQIHRLLRPFMLRRLKADVEKSLPKKKEIYLMLGLSEMQKKLYKQILSKNIDVVNGAGDRLQLLNVLMQLRKWCNHPYLFDGMEPGPPYEDGPHLYENSMKFKVLDILLKRLLTKGDKILIFSQMTRLLDILDDYLRWKGIDYWRIDGQTSAMDRETRIEEFQKEGSSKEVFILSTRAGGLGIDLYAANTVIIFDSDWNPQVDLQAIDRAHRIGQKREVTIYRFVTQGAIEEVIVRRAAKKLKLDNLIMQKGKMLKNNDKKVSREELMNAIHWGAQNIMSTEDVITDTDIDKILEYGNEKIDDGPGMYYFEGEDYKLKHKLEAGEMFLETCRERKKGGIYDIDQYYREAFNVPIKDKKRLKGWRALANGGYDHQFFNSELLDQLDEKLKKYKEYQEKPESWEEVPIEFTEEDQKEKEKLLSEGYSNWSK